MLSETGFNIEKIEYEKTPKVEIKSVYHLLGKRDLRINPFIWRIFKPLTARLALAGKSSIMYIKAIKSEH